MANMMVDSLDLLYLKAEDIASGAGEQKRTALGSLKGVIVNKFNGCAQATGVDLSS